MDMVGIVTTFEGDPLPSGDIASRLGGFSDVEKMEKATATDGDIIDVLLGKQEQLYTTTIRTIRRSSTMAAASDCSTILCSMALMRLIRFWWPSNLYGCCRAAGPSRSDQGLRRPFYAGYVRRPISSSARWCGPVIAVSGRKRCAPASIRSIRAVIRRRSCPTSILTLNWADAVSQAHNLDAQLQQIEAKSKEGFVFQIDLQVQIHVPDTNAPRVISMVGTMLNLVNEVLQAAVGNHFRDKLQSMPAIRFIETRQQVQEEAFKHIKEQLDQYRVETRGVYIQDVIFPEDLVKVLTQREIANQEIETYKKQRAAQDERISMENAKGTAEMQADLAKSKVGVDIKTNNANARTEEARGEAELSARPARPGRAG